MRLAKALRNATPCATLCKIKTISISELHAHTGRWVRWAARHGGILVTDRGEPIAKIIPENPPEMKPYFANRKLSPEFAAFMEREARRGPRRFNVTEGISEDREDRA